MSERGDFFDSASKSATKQKPLPTRGDFFSGADIDLPVTPKQEKAAATKTPPNFSAPYAYFDSDARRAAGIQEIEEGKTIQQVRDDPIGTLQSIPAGVNRGVMNLLGMPGDTAQNLIDMGGAGLSLLRGDNADEQYQVPDRAQIPLTSDWFSRQLDEAAVSLGGSPVTQPVADNGIANVLYGAAAGVPGGALGGGGAAPLLAGAAGGGAGALAAEAGGDPSLQAASALLAGHAAAQMPPRAPRTVAPNEPTTAPIDPEQAALNKAASSQSMGAAGAAVDLQKLSPPLRDAVRKAVQETGGAVNPEVLAREVQADSLPVKVNLSEGQKLGDARLISEERNARGKTPGYVEGFEAQNKALTENLRVFRDTAGEDVFSTNPVEHGDTIIARYKAIDEAREADISGKYEALRDAAGGDFPVDTQTLLKNTQSALKKDLATSNAPPDVMRALDEYAQAGAMTLEDFEGLRTSLARTQRTAADGQVRHAAGVIRDQLEAIPLQGNAAQLKGLADTARAAARERFEALKADPAYKAAVNDSVAPDNFIRKFVINDKTATRDNVARLAAAMADDPAATATLKVATIDHLRQAAGIDAGYNGKFSQAGYNKALRALEAKLGSLVDPALAEHIQNLGDVARYSQFQPEGSYVNNSNTFVAAAAEKGADMLEGAANLKAGGIPVGSWVRQNITDRQGRKAAAKTFAPGSGLTKLSNLTNTGKKK